MQSYRKETPYKSKLYNTGKIVKKSRMPPRFINHKLWETVRNQLPNEDESTVFYIGDEKPTLLGRLEMGLGLIVKELKDSCLEIRDFMLDKNKDKIAKDTLRNLLKEMLDGKEVGTGPEIKQQFRDAYTNEKLIELINYAFTHNVDRSAEEALAKTFFKNNINVVDEQFGYVIQKIKDTIAPEILSEQEKIKEDIQINKDDLFIGDTHSLGLLRQNINMAIIEYLAKNKASIISNMKEDNWMNKYQVKHLAEVLVHYPKEQNERLIALVAQDLPKEKIKEFLSHYNVSTIKKEKNTNVIYVKLGTEDDYGRILTKDGCEIDGQKISIKPARMNKKEKPKDGNETAQNGGQKAMDVVEQ